MKYKSPTIITLKELREQFPKYIDAVAEGQSFTVVKRSHPVFQITPLQDEGQWSTIADFTQLDKDGVSIEDILKEL